MGQGQTKRPFTACVRFGTTCFHCSARQTCAAPFFAPSAVVPSQEVTPVFPNCMHRPAGCVHGRTHRAAGSPGQGAQPRLLQHGHGVCLVGQRGTLRCLPHRVTGTHGNDACLCGADQQPRHDRDHQSFDRKGDCHRISEPLRCASGSPGFHGHVLVQWTHCTGRVAGRADHPAFAARRCQPIPVDHAEQTDPRPFMVPKKDWYDSEPRHDAPSATVLSFCVSNLHLHPMLQSLCFFFVVCTASHFGSIISSCCHTF